MMSTVATRTSDIGVYVDALGIVTPLITVSVCSLATGQIVKTLCREGQHVKVDDALVKIDSRPYQAAMFQAGGQLVRDPAVPDDAKFDLENYEEVYGGNATPKQQYDTQVTLVHQDEGQVELDRGNLDGAKVNLANCHTASTNNGCGGRRLVHPGTKGAGEPYSTMSHDQSVDVEKTFGRDETLSKGRMTNRSIAAT